MPSGNKFIATGQSERIGLEHTSKRKRIISKHNRPSNSVQKAEEKIIGMVRGK